MGMGVTMPVPEAIRVAISRHWRLAITYHFYSRVVEPFAVGNDGVGSAVLLAYQVSGGADDGPPRGWKRMNVGEIRGAMLIADDRPFEQPAPPSDILDDFSFDDTVAPARDQARLS